MNTQGRNGMAINAPGAKATPQNNQTVKKLVMKPLKCVFECWWRGGVGVEGCVCVCCSSRTKCKVASADQQVKDLRNVLVAFQYFGVHCMLHHSFVKCSHAALGVWLSCSIHLHLLPIPLSAFACLEIGDKSATACGYQLQQWNRCQL